MRKPYPKNRKSSSRVGINKGVPKPRIARTCKHCGSDYLGYNGTHYCSDRCVLLSKITITESGCWEWGGYRRKPPNHYGEFDFKDGRRMLTNRAAWLLLKGSDPGGQQVLHGCDNPPCCNPDHLFLGTIQDNMNDRNTKGRQARGERHGFAKLTEDDVRAIRADKKNTHRALAKRYGVFETTISEVRHGNYWKHVKQDG